MSESRYGGRRRWARAATGAALPLRLLSRPFCCDGPAREACPLECRATAVGPQPDTFVNRSTLLVLIAAAGCAAQRPQVLTPVRVDTVGRVPATASPVTAEATAQSSPRTTSDDPISRIDRME